MDKGAWQAPWGCTVRHDWATNLMLLLHTCSRWQRDLWDCSRPGSSAHGIFQARILEWVAITSSREWICIYTGFLGGSYYKESARYAGDLGLIPGSEDLLQRVGHNWATYTHTHTQRTNSYCNVILWSISYCLYTAFLAHKSLNLVFSMLNPQGLEEYLAYSVSKCILKELLLLVYHKIDLESFFVCLFWKTLAGYIFKLKIMSI